MPVFQLQFLRCHESAGQSVYGLQVRRQVPVFHHILKRLFFGHHGNQTRLCPFPGAVRFNEHAHKAVHRVNQRMVKVQVYVNRMVPKEPLPDRFADFLGDTLVVPAPRAAQVPLRMIAPELLQSCLPYRNYGARVNYRFSRSTFSRSVKFISP